MQPIEVNLTNPKPTIKTIIVWANVYEPVCGMPTVGGLYRTQADAISYKGPGGKTITEQPIPLRITYKER